MKVNIRQLKKWIAALDSGKYKQGYCLLQMYDNKYCCLGVACKVLIPAYKQDVELDGILKYTTPKDQKYAPDWLKNISDDFNRKTGKHLTYLNDHEDFSFAEIATLLELVYIHKMLD